MLWTNSINTGNGIGGIVTSAYQNQFLDRFPQIIPKIVANSRGVRKVELAKRTLMYTDIYERADGETACGKVIDQLLSAGTFTLEELAAAYREYEAEMNWW
jgi:hypothetical protein